MDTAFLPVNLDYKPHFPAGPGLGVGIIGCGTIAKAAHLPAYNKYGVNVVGVYDVSPAATTGVQQQFGVPHVFGSLDELLSHPEIQVVDIATHPAERVGIMHRALEASKHILAEKPFTPDLKSALEVVAEAERRGLKVAVNQSGRWNPAWRVATLLIEQGLIGDVLAVTHMYDVNFNWWIPGTVFDGLQHFAIYDYSIHWIDIIRCWMGGKKVTEVRARDYRNPNQVPESKANYGSWVEFAYEDGSSAMIRGVGCAETKKGGHPFWIHGREGTIRGSVQLGTDFVELEREGASCRYALEGQWYPDGFAGAMGELLCAIAENREPFNSARHNLLSLQMMFAACRSADEGGCPVKLEEVF